MHLLFTLNVYNAHKYLFTGCLRLFFIYC